MTRALGVGAAAAALLVALPWLGLSPFHQTFLYMVCHWAVLALSWNILSGYSGYFSFGHGAFFGVGMYASAGLSANLNWPFLWTLPAAAACAALLGLALGAVVFRVRAVRGELFALLTLAVTFVVATLVLNTRIDGGPGIALSGVAVPALGPTPAASLYLMALGAALLTLFVAWRIHASKLGLALFAIHDDEDAAEVMGVPTYRAKLLALAVSCALAGLAGGIHALFVNYVTAGETFNISVPLTVVLMSVLGGTRHWAGPALGALAITVLMFAFSAGDHAVAGRAAVGVVLVAVILFLPQGLLGRVSRRRANPAIQEKATAPADAATPLAADHSTAPASAAARPASRPVSTTARPLLEVHALSKSFTGVQALEGVSLQVMPGEILGLLGPNGSGKSTFINLVSGHHAPSSGRMLFDGKDLSTLPAHRIAHSGIARTYQIPRPFAHLSVRDNVALVARFGAARMHRSQSLLEADQWLAFTGLQARADALPDALNLHQRKFLELARALAGRPRLVLLDEVLSGLTPTEMDEAVALIRRIRENGATIVFVEHVMHAVMALTDRIVVLNHGKLIAQGAPQAVMRDPAVVSAYLGAAHA